MKNNDEKKKDFIDDLNRLLLKHDACLSIEDKATGWDNHDPLMVAYIDGYRLDINLGCNLYPSDGNPEKD